MDRANVLIAGGGIIGSCLAWALAENGVDDVVVVDLDLAGVYASSELNAGGARATWWQPVNIETCLATLEFFRENLDEFGFKEKGYLWLYSDEALFSRAKKKRELQNSYSLGVEVLQRADIVEQFPILDRGLDEILGATFSPRDGLVNPNAVRSWYRKKAEEKGVVFLNRHYIAGVVTDRVTGSAGSIRRVAALDVSEVQPGDPYDESGVIREILTTHRVPPQRFVEESRIACDTVVNCLGAWSPVFSAKIGVSDVTEPVRRQISLVGVQARDGSHDTELSDIGMIVDSSDLYFHAEGGHILAGYSNPTEAPGFDFTYDGESFFEESIWPRLAHRSSSFERCGHLRGWAGLYAVTPDRSGIAGTVDGFSNLFEAHSFTGRGVMQSYGVGRAMAQLLARGEFGDVDLRALSRRRFKDEAQWVMEDLHI